MIALNDEMREHINNAIINRKPCILVTASATGYPGIGYRGSMMVFDDQHLAYWERGQGGAVNNVKENPHVAVLYRDPDTRAGWRFYGDAHVYTEGPVREQVWERIPEIEKQGDPSKQGAAVLVRVDVVLPFHNQDAQRREAG